MSEIRYNPLYDTHVIISPERLHRPDCMLAFEEKKAMSKACPFCEGNEGMTPPEIYAIRAEGSFANEKGWQTRVVPNLYKAVQIETAHAHHYGLFEHWEGFGAHEVIIDTPQHHTSMAQWSEESVIDWLKTLRARSADLRKDSRFAYLSLFKNEGDQAGATQMHSHTQLIGLPIIPKAQREEFGRSYEHYKHHGMTLLASMLIHEEEDDRRIISSSGAFTAFCPYASAYPFEVMIASSKVLGQIDTIGDEAISQLAPLLLGVLKKMKAQLGCFDFNLCIGTAPLQAVEIADEVVAFANTACSFYLRIMPRIYRHGGFEHATGMIINPVAPELAAKLLRESSDE